MGLGPGGRSSLAYKNISSESLQATLLGRSPRSYATHKKSSLTAFLARMGRGREVWSWDQQRRQALKTLHFVQSVFGSLLVYVNCIEADKHNLWQRIASKGPIHRIS
jgi:hypothetical protein